MPGGGAYGGPGGDFTISWGATGLTRMFGAEIGGQVAWLVPAALVLGAAAFWLLRRAPRTDARRAQVLAWAAWLVITGLTFSLMAGIFHAYYTVALAPAIAALVGIGASLLWARRERLWAVGTLAGVTLATAAWSSVLLSRSSTFLPWLQAAVSIVGVLAALALVGGHWFGRRVLVAGAILAVAAGLAGPTAYTLQTVSTAHAGSIVTAGPTVAGGPGAGPHAWPGGGPGGGPGEGPVWMPELGTGQQPRRPPQGQGGPNQGSMPAPGQIPGFGPNADGGGPGMGGLLDGATVSTQVATLLAQDAGAYRWVAAAIGSQNAASYQLATQQSVMPVGGFNGSDPSPTLAQFKAWVAGGKIHWFIASGNRPYSDGSSVSAQITSWVEQTFTARTVDGTTLYDLSTGASR